MPLPPRVTSTVLATIITVATAGCSFVFVDGPPAAHAKLPYFECSTSVALPTIDLVLGLAAGVPAVAQLNDGSTSGTSREAVIIAAGEAALFAASAIYGYTKTGQCREAKTALLDRMMRAPPPAYGPGPGYPGPYQPPPAYDPWLSPPPGAFAHPPAAVPPGTAPTPPPAAPAPWGPAPAAPAPGAGSPTSPPASPPPSSPPSPPPPAKVVP